jgi:hypothetical protein
VATPHSRLRDALPRLSEAGLLCLLRVLTCAALYASGFRALSDDDYARISIAQRFAASPSIDPSQTSWLPAPFWAYGAAFRVFGTGIHVAQVTAVVLSCAATLMVYSAARVLGACRPAAFVGAALSSVLPYSALLGAAAVPEVPCAALILFGAATLASLNPKARALGGLSLFAACLSRYEAWPVAGVFASFGIWDAARNHRATLLAGAGVALLGPVLWLFVGRLEHGDALFFVARVANYRRALGGDASGSFATRLLDYPSLLLRAEPELFGLFALVSLVEWRHLARGELVPYRRAALALLALLAFLVLGSVRDGVPTHHAARVLLPIWFFTCVLCGHGLAHRIARTARGARISLIAASVVAIALGLLAKPRLAPAESVAERTPELEAGGEAKRRDATRLAIDTSDYGYFAVQAGFGSPAQCSVLDDHDPRHSRPLDSFASPAALSRALRAQQARFLIATHEHAPLASSVCRELWHNSAFTLLECPGLASAAR